MSQMINIGPMVAKIVRDMLDEQNAVLDVDTVYSRMIEVYGHDIFDSERMLAEVAVRQKIKSHLKSAHSINGEEGGDQLALIKDDAPATLSVKQPGGGYAYVPLRMARVEDLDSATSAKKDNISNAKRALKKWTQTIGPIRDVMEAEKVTFGEAQKIIADRDRGASEVKPRRRKAQ